MRTRSYCSRLYLSLDSVPTGPIPLARYLLVLFLGCLRRDRSTAGIVDGQALRIGGGPGHSALIFRVKVLAHPLYQLNGKDVQIELPLAPWEAALGAKVAVPTLGGTVELTIPPGAQSGQKLRLRGRGMPASPNGDQLVILKLVTPAAESAKAREAYERMKRELHFDARADWPPARA